MVSSRRTGAGSGQNVRAESGVEGMLSEKTFSRMEVGDSLKFMAGLPCENRGESEKEAR